MKKIKFLSLSLVCILIIFSSFSSAQEITSSVISSGSTSASSSSYIIKGTIGQTFVDTAAGTNYQVNQGFWYAVRKAHCTVYPPTSFDVTDNPDDDGGYVLVTFSACINHPGMSTTVAENYAIDCYYVYRSTTSNFNDAVQVGTITATELPSSTDTTLTAVISTGGNMSDNAYFWIAAVRGDVVSEVTGPNRAIGAKNTSLKSDFNSDGTVGLADLSYFAFAYGNTDEYDALYDLDSNGTVGLSDLSIFAGQYGTSLGKPAVPSANKEEEKTDKKKFLNKRE